jgi:hypothetical protein
MPQSAFIVRPFGRKPYIYPAKSAASVDKLLAAQKDLSQDRWIVTRPVGDPAGEVEINFDLIDQLLIRPALEGAKLHGETTGAVVEAGNIREDMFNRLITADLVIADVSMSNPNVYYELGLRQAFRDKFTFVIRCDLNAYPFDLQTDRYFAYELLDLIKHPAPIVESLTTALRKTLNQYRADSPVFKLMPQLESEDRSRFLAVPEDFREEVERAHRQRQREYLDLMALECENHLWEIEGLRVVGRAQFEANFIEGARDTWQRIATRYPDDPEANTVLSTIYQRFSDRTRSEQALARVTRSRAMSPQRASELRGLGGRNLKSAWMAAWKGETDLQKRRIKALSSPLLQRAIDAYVGAFKIDLNSSYAGLNALTLQIVQAELIDDLREEWRALQRHGHDETRAYTERIELIDHLAHALLLATESDRERLALHGQGDPWFEMLEAAVACVLSDQPKYVAQQYVEACYYAPPKSDVGARASLQMYKDLAITGTFKHFPKPTMVGSLGTNVDAALDALNPKCDATQAPKPPRRLILFVGLRADDVKRAPSPTAGKTGINGTGAARAVLFPRSLEATVWALVEKAVKEAIGSIPADEILCMAGGASGGDLIFHDVCQKQGLAAQMFLPLPKPQHIGTYVSPAGSEWVTRFNGIYRHLHEVYEEAEENSFKKCVRVFAESADLPRWLQGLENYNIGRRSMLWMLHQANNLVNALEGNVETTLIALQAPRTPQDRRGFGGIQEAIRLAQMRGATVLTIELPRLPRDVSEATAVPDARDGAQRSISREAAELAMKRQKTRSRDGAAASTLEVMAPAAPDAAEAENGVLAAEDASQQSESRAPGNGSAPTGVMKP